jgi:predicted NBD/HSP70 family sugar kinase
MNTYARHLMMGISASVHLMDPELIILCGGIVQNNPTMMAALREQMANHDAAWEHRQLRVCLSRFGYHAGVLGAAAVPFERLRSVEEL